MTAKMQQPKVYIVIPAMDGRIHIAGMLSIIQLIHAMATKGIYSTVSFAQSSDICQSRSILAIEFLNTDFTHILMIDSDLCFDHNQAMKLIESGHMVCGGVYPKKTHDFHPEFTVEYSGPSVNGFRKANYIGAGLLLIHRQVFEKIKTKHPELSVKHKESGYTFTSFFQNGVIDGKYRSEDAAFCYRWAQMGGTVWALEDCMFTHFGAFGWSGSWAQMLEKIEAQEKAA